MDNLLGLVQTTAAIAYKNRYEATKVRWSPAAQVLLLQSTDGNRLTEVHVLGRNPLLRTAPILDQLPAVPLRSPGGSANATSLLYRTGHPICRQTARIPDMLPVQAALL
jgi:hypothetical protein